MMYKGRSFDLVIDGEDVVMQGVHEDYRFAGLGYQLQASARKQAGGLYVDDSGDLQADYEVFDESEWIENNIEQAVEKALSENLFVVTSHYLN